MRRKLNIFVAIFKEPFYRAPKKKGQKSVENFKHKIVSAISCLDCSGEIFEVMIKNNIIIFKCFMKKSRVGQAKSILETMY